MELIDGRAIKLKTRLADKITKAIPKSKVIGVDPETDISDVMVYWGRDELKKLAELGFKKLPPPPLRTYDWPGVYRPMAHQLTTAEFLAFNGG